MGSRTARLTLSSAKPAQDSHELASTLSNLGTTQVAEGKLDEARLSFDRALGLREKLLGAKHPDTAISLSLVAGLNLQTRDLPSAHKRATALGALSHMEERAGRSARAVEHQAIALESHQTHNGLDSPATRAAAARLSALCQGKKFAQCSFGARR